METVKLSTKGQIVIPKNIRESHHLSAGTEFSIVFMGDEIRLKPLPVFAETHAEDGMGLLAREGRKQLSEEATDLAIGDMLKEADEASKG
ncbi:MAG: AbrB/MazE/SpoVT family DNA-binding domain-containing protein [Sulfuricellaceae bacterium]|jgi:AbrB family looped-hinge helix DNA binding protein